MDWADIVGRILQEANRRTLGLNLHAEVTHATTPENRGSLNAGASKCSAFGVDPQSGPIAAFHHLLQLDHVTGDYAGHDYLLGSARSVRTEHRDRHRWGNRAGTDRCGHLGNHAQAPVAAGIASVCQRSGKPSGDARPGSSGHFCRPAVALHNAHSLGPVHHHPVEPCLYCVHRPVHQLVHGAGQST